MPAHVILHATTDAEAVLCTRWQTAGISLNRLT
jgi:hypothetical protein